MKQKELRANDLTKLFQQHPEPFEVVAQPTAHCYRVIIDEEFEHVSQFAQLVEILEQAGEQDVVQIRLHTPGGALASVYPLLSAMRNTDAFVHVHADSDIASAGTLVLLAADMVTMNQYITIMFHNVQGGAFGHQGNVDAQSKHYTKLHEKLVRDHYLDFLTEEEIIRLLDGKEFYFEAEEFAVRLKARQEKWKAGEEECSCGECEENDDELLNQEVKLSLSENNTNVEDLKRILKEWNEAGSPAVVEDVQEYPLPVRVKKSRTKKEDK